MLELLESQFAVILVVRRDCSTRFDFINLVRRKDRMHCQYADERRSLFGPVQMTVKAEKSARQ